jgi:GNAT superfamily N-acetyltransferase
MNHYPLWREEALARTHDRKAFDCGESSLNEYLRCFARQNHESGGAKTFVAVAPEKPARILGYYSLSPASLGYARAPEILRRGLGRYEVPVYRLGRLAVDRGAQGRGLGGQLLIAACARCLLVAAHVGGVALLIDAKSDRAKAWYLGFGAVPLADAPGSLVLPLATVEKLLDGVP